MGEFIMLMMNQYIPTRYFNIEYAKTIGRPNLCSDLHEYVLEVKNFMFPLVENAIRTFRQIRLTTRHVYLSHYLQIICERIMPAQNVPYFLSTCACDECLSINEGG